MRQDPNPRMPVPQASGRHHHLFSKKALSRSRRKRPGFPSRLSQGRILASRESDGGGLATTLVSVVTLRGSLSKDDRA